MLRLGHVEVVVVRVQIRTPMQPHLARVLGQQVLLFEAVLEREPFRAFPHEEDVVRVLEHELRDLGRRLDAFQRAHRTGPLGGPVHAGCVELHDPFGVRQTAVPDGVVLRIELLDLHTLDRRIQRVRTLHQHVECLLHRAEPVRAGDCHRLRRPAARGRERPRRSHGIGDVRRRGGGDADSAGSDELATGQEVGHTALRGKVIVWFYPLGRRLSTCSTRGAAIPFRPWTSKTRQAPPRWSAAFSARRSPLPRRCC